MSISVSENENMLLLANLVAYLLDNYEAEWLEEDGLEYILVERGALEDICVSYLLNYDRSIKPGDFYQLVKNVLAIPWDNMDGDNEDGEN